MTRDDQVFPVDQDGVHKSERSNAVGDLTNLMFGMNTGIARELR
jgi:hypothetical protein